MCKVKKLNYYQELLHQLPESLVSQIDTSEECVKFSKPDKCWKSCKGYEFYIGEKSYQKCMVNCFEFIVNGSDMSSLQELVEAESRMRLLFES